jgi:hypothetical protein
MRPYPDTSLSDRSNAPMPVDRAAAQPWLVAGRLLLAPFPPRTGGLTHHEAAAIEEMGARLERDRRDGLLPDCAAFWLSYDGRTTPVTATRAWLQITALQHTVIDLDLLRTLGRAIPVTLIVRRTSPALVPVPPAVRGRPRKARVMAEIEAAA